MALPTTPTYSTEAEYNVHLYDTANKTTTAGGPLDPSDWARYALQAEAILDNELFCIPKECWGSEDRIYPLSDGTEIPNNLKLAHIYITERLYVLSQAPSGVAGGAIKSETWADDRYTIQYTEAQLGEAAESDLIPELAQINIEKTCKVSSGFITY